MYLYSLHYLVSVSNRYFFLQIIYICPVNVRQELAFSRKYSVLLDKIRIFSQSFPVIGRSCCGTFFGNGGGANCVTFLLISGKLLVRWKVSLKEDTASWIYYKVGALCFYYIWVILRKTAYFSNEILKEKNRCFLSSFHGNLFYICSGSHF